MKYIDKFRRNSEEIQLCNRWWGVDTKSEEAVTTKIESKQRGENNKQKHDKKGNHKVITTKEDKPPREKGKLTKMTYNYVELFMMVDRGIFANQMSMKPPNVEKRKAIGKYYNFHKDQGQPTEECWSLKHQIRNHVNKGNFNHLYKCVRLIVASTTCIVSQTRDVINSIFAGVDDVSLKQRRLGSQEK